MTGAPLRLTTRDLADRWGLAVKTLANHRSAGRGPAFLKLGGRVLYRLPDVEAYEARHLVNL